MNRVLGVALTLGAAAGYGQFLGAYYSGVGEDTIGSSGLNTLLFAFFNPTAMSTHVCNFTAELLPGAHTATGAPDPCVVAAPNSGNQNLAWAMQAINATQAALSANTAPVRNGAPTFFFSFGGENQGGAAWDAIFASNDTANLFAQNAAALARVVTAAAGGNIIVGIDLDIESVTTLLPAFGAFIASFRAAAPYDVVPLQLCALSGMAQPGNDDHFKLALVQAYGPTSRGLSHVNFMVDDVNLSCDGMAVFWLDPALEFLPLKARVWGLWGEIFPTFILHDPGCTNGAQPLFPFWAANEINTAIWEWWTGTTADIVAVLQQIRATNASA